MKSSNRAVAAGPVQKKTFASALSHLQYRFLSSVGFSYSFFLRLLVLPNCLFLRYYHLIYHLKRVNNRRDSLQIDASPQLVLMLHKYSEILEKHSNYATWHDLC